MNDSDEMKDGQSGTGEWVNRRPAASRKSRGNRVAIDTNYISSKIDGSGSGSERGWPGIKKNT